VPSVNVTWWCSAQTGPWTWTPQLYPGIWLLMLGLAVAYARAVRRWRRASFAPEMTRGRVACFASALVGLWLVLDWPVGALAAGYLLSAHMLQYIAMSLVLTPLLLAGIPPGARPGLLASRPMRPLRRFVERPLAAFLLFNGVLVVTHVPLVADTLKPLQLGSMAIDLTWLVSSLLFWWALATPPASGDAAALYGRRMLFLLGTKPVPILLGAFFVLSEFPLYRTYELAVRVFDLSAKGDQTIAGWFMWMGATPILVLHLGAAFFVWYEVETRRAGEA
jgi:cytochrome c oxidase assembly factor CtaG